MKWINENLLYIIWFLSCIIFIALFFVLRSLKPHMQRRVIVFLSFTAAAILAFRIVFFSIRGQIEGGSALAWRKFVFALPGHLCGISSIMIPIAVMTRKKFLLDYTYYIALPAALFAIILNSSVGITAFAGDLDTYIFWIPHLIYVIVPIFLIIFEGLRPSFKSIPKVLFILFAFLTIDHIINKVVSYAFNDYVVNYLYTMGPGDFINRVGEGLAEKRFHVIGFLKIFWDFMPIEYFYMYLFTPIAIALCFIMGLPFWLLQKKVNINRH